MSKHPQIEEAKISALIFFITILIIAFMSLYVASIAREGKTVSPERVEMNLTPPGRLYSR